MSATYSSETSPFEILLSGASDEVSPLDTDTEADTYTSFQDRTRSPKFQHGVLIHWNEESSIGVVKGSNDEDFYVNTDLTVAGSPPSPHSKVFFIPADAPSREQNNNLNRIATCLFSLGDPLSGIIKWHNPHKGFAFAQVSDSYGNSGDIYLSMFGANSPLSLGTPVRFTISMNDLGPIGVDAFWGEQD